MRYFRNIFLILVLSINMLNAQELPDGKSKNKKAEAFFEQAIDHYSNRDYDLAIGKLEEALKKDPNFLNCLDLLGKCYIENENKTMAISTYQKLIGINSDFWIAYYELGLLYFESDEFDLAKNELNKFLKYKDLPNEERLIAERTLKNCDFARIAKKNPVEFKPVNLGKSINTRLSEYFPTLSADENTLIFTQMDGNLQEDFFISQLENGKWTDAMPLGENLNTPENEGASTLSSDGQYMFYIMCQNPKNIGTCDIWFTFLKGDKWQAPIHLPSPINTKYKETQPSLSADGVTLYFSSNREGGFGGMDIWKTTFENSRWTDPVNLGATINTDGDEESPFIHHDGTTLYFASDGKPGMGKRDLYYSKIKENGSFDTAVNLGYPINTESNEEGLIINRSGTKGYFSSDKKTNPNHKGRVDIYEFEIPEKIRPNKVSYVKGFVFDAKSKEKLVAKIELFDLANSKLAGNRKSNSKTGQFLFVLLGNKNYALNVEAEGYMFHSENFELKQNSVDSPFTIMVGLNKIASGEKIVLKNIFFETNKFDLKQESMLELDKVLLLLNKNPSIKIEISGHTDNVGKDISNQVLSENRAKSVYDWLISKGIPKGRLSFKGYGQSMPIAPNTDENGRAQNRRTEIKIL